MFRKVSQIDTMADPGLGDWMLWLGEQLGGRGLFDAPPLMHDKSVLTKLPQQRELMGHEQRSAT